MSQTIQLNEGRNLVFSRSQERPYSMAKALINLSGYKRRTGATTLKDHAGVGCADTSGIHDLGVRDAL